MPPPDSPTPTPPLCLVHLVRRSNGVGPLARFLDAYDRHPGGVGHELALLLKGFDGGRLDAGHAAALAGRPFRRLFVADRGFDLVPYHAAARSLPHAHLCFVNSFSRPLDPDWLAKLYAAARAPGVGIASATGSWDTVAAHRRAVRRQLHAHWPNHRGYARLLFVRRSLLPFWADDAWYWAHFPAFPSAHARTNAFVMDRRVMLRTWAGLRVADKFDAYRFEHGRRSLTRRLARRGLAAVVVGRDGRSYAADQWPASGTFWQAGQENLLVADNQTDRYAHADEAGRAAFREAAWGPPGSSAATAWHRRSPTRGDEPDGLRPAGGGRG